MSLGEVLSMGGYGAYVWTAYSLAAVILLYNFIKPWLMERRIRSRHAERDLQEINQ